MPLLLELFLVFLKIGVVSFGGGYGMIPLIQQEVLSRGWLDADTLLNYIAIAESTPGPIAINMATFVGSNQAGFVGSLVATIGIVLPAFCIILLIAAVFRSFRNNKYVGAAFRTITPVILSLILSTGLLLVVYCIYANYHVGDPIGKWNWQGTVILVVVGIAMLVYRCVRKKSMPPIAIILLSAACGMLYFVP